MPEKSEAFIIMETLTRHEMRIVADKDVIEDEADKLRRSGRYHRVFVRYKEGDDVES